MLREDGYGVQFTSVISKELTKFVGFAFADDTGLIHMGDDGIGKLFEISYHMKKLLDLWEHGL